jgi:SAM-dependent methyltransferase
MTEANRAQIDQWDGRVGQKWAELADRLDVMLQAPLDLLAAAAGPVAGLRVLDVGCGSGASSLRWLDGGATVTGVDVSSGLLAVAQARTGGRAELVLADAAAWRGDAPFDLLLSRFGVMFFADPVSAFENLAANLRPGARLLFCCWRGAAENGWVTVPMGAIRDLLPAAPPPDPHAPGPFAFADSARVEGILARAGFREIRVSPHDIPVVMAADGGVGAALALALQIGPAASALAEADEAVRGQAKERLRTALARHEQDGRVVLDGAIWLVEAVRA